MHLIIKHPEELHAQHPDYYPNNRQLVVLGNKDAMPTAGVAYALPDLLPGCSVPVSNLWPPVFE